MASALPKLENKLYELAKEFPQLRPSASNPKRFTSFCPIHGKDKTSDLIWTLDSADQLVITCKVCGPLTLDDIRNPKPMNAVQAVIGLDLEPLTDSGFDYSALSDADQVKAATVRIKARLKRSVADIVEIGKELTTIKNQLPHGQFLPWIAAEFEMSKDTAQNFMNVWDRFGKNGIIPNLRPTVLYELSAPSTPDSVIEQAVEAAAAGDKVTIADVKDWKAERVMPMANTDKVETDIKENNVLDLIKTHNIPAEYHAELIEAAEGWAVNSDASNREGTSVAVKGFAWWDEKSGALAKRRIKVGEKAKNDRLLNKFGSSPLETTTFGFLQRLKEGNSGPIADLLRCADHFDSFDLAKLEKLHNALAEIQQAHNKGINELQSRIDVLLLPLERDITPHGNESIPFRMLDDDSKCLINNHLH